MMARPLGQLPCVQRDLLAAIAANPGANGQELWSDVEKMRQETVSDTTVRDHLDELVDRGLVERARTTQTKHEHRLTLESRELLDEESEWLADR